MLGSNVAITRLATKLTLVSSEFASSNLSSWYLSALYARVTEIPKRFSLAIRFKLSVNFWSFANLGRAIAIHIPTIINNIKTAIPVVKDSSQFFPVIFKTAQTANIGAFINNCKPITINVCTWVTSFVERVIKLAVEKLFISSIEKSWTLSYNLDLSVAEKFEAIFAASAATITDAIKLPKAQRSIHPPAVKISLISLPCVWTSLVISLM